MSLQINIKTSEANKEVVSQLTKKLNLGSENIISRIALAYSLSKKERLNPEIDLSDSKGKEYKEDVLFGKHRDFYVAMICQLYLLDKKDEHIPKYLKMHIDQGLQLISQIFEDNPNYFGFDFLIDNIQGGINAIEGADVTFEHVDNFKLKFNKTYTTKPLKLLVGANEDGEEIYFTPNNTKLYSNCHIAVAGQSGSGKTYFAQRLLERIIEASDKQTNFIFLDFKGLKEGEETSDEFRSFFEKTNAKLISAPHTPFPVNPLSFINATDKTKRILGINKFVDIITNFANLGKVQAQILKEATKEVFEEQKNGELPSLKQINDKVQEMVEGKASQLTEILESLTEVTLFETGGDSSFLNSNYYLSLSGSLGDTVRLTSTFLIIYYIYTTFMNLDNTPEENDHKGIRYVLLIDEAHVVFKDKKAKEILEKVLREIRSKGVSVMLLSQGIEEFDQPSFDFSSMCETAFLMNIKDKTNIKQASKFLGLGDSDRNKLVKNMGQLQNRQAISNIKDFDRGRLFELK